MASLSDRIAHDPHLSVVLHEMISVVSAVRATAGILAESEALDIQVTIPDNLPRYVAETPAAPVKKAKAAKPAGKKASAKKAAA